MHWYVEFERWYVGGFLTLFSLVMIWKGAAFSSCSRFFYFELRDPRLKARFAPVVERRYELEGGNDIAWRVAGLSAMVFAVLVLLRILNPLVGYALVCAVLAIAMSQIYVNMRNHSERRAASLQRRTPASSVPVVWYVGAAVSAVLPLALIAYPQLRTSAIIVAVACLGIVIVSARTAAMAALLTGADPDIELYVDNRLRWSRVAGLLMLAYASSYVYIALSRPVFRSGPQWISNVELASWLLFIGFGIWALARFFLERMRPKETHA